MARIVLTTIGSLGDLHPQIALGLELRARGHEVVFATLEAYREKIESLAFAFHPIRPDVPVDDPKLAALMMDARKGTKRLLRDYVFGSIRETYDDLLEACEGADFLVAGELAYAGRLAAEMRDLKWAYCALAPFSFCSAYDLPEFPALRFLSRLRSWGPPTTQRVVNFFKLVSRRWTEPLAQLRRELGLPPSAHPLFEGKYSPYVVLALFSPLLAAPQPDWPASAVITGFASYDGKGSQAGLPEQVERFLAAGEPPILFTLGSAAVLDPGTFYRESVKATVRLGRRAVLLIGKNRPPADLPKNILAVEYLPYSAIMSRACAIVHQGGIGTTAEALRSGRPTLVVPYSHDQPDNAMRLERLGTSQTILRKKYTARRAIRQLQALLTNPEYAANAQSVARVVRVEDGVLVACDLIERQCGVKEVVAGGPT